MELRSILNLIFFFKLDQNHEGKTGIKLINTLYHEN